MYKVLDQEDAPSRAGKLSKAEVHAIFKCGTCGNEYGEWTQHPQSWNTCPNCLKSITTSGLSRVPEEDIVTPQEALKVFNEEDEPDA